MKDIYEKREVTAFVGIKRKILLKYTQEEFSLEGGAYAFFFATMSSGTFAALPTLSLR